MQDAAYTVTRSGGNENERDENEACTPPLRVPDPFIRCAGRYVAVSIDLDPRPPSLTRPTVCLATLTAHRRISPPPRHPRNIPSQGVDADDVCRATSQISYVRKRDKRWRSANRKRIVRPPVSGRWVTSRRDNETVKYE